jgi:hypothetical protein
MKAYLEPPTAAGVPFLQMKVHFFSDSDAIPLRMPLAGETACGCPDACLRQPLQDLD